MTLLECIPNVSEGRREAVVDSFVRAVTECGVTLLDRSSDSDHNRTVLTLVGTTETLHRGLISLYERVLAEISIEGHRGAHPRIGALDVAPFVPLSGFLPSHREEAVAASRRLAAEVANRFDLPVFLYEEASFRSRAFPEPRTLPEIRKGGLEGLRKRMETGAQLPDFGPREPHATAGVTVIGARFFLIAFNAVLDTTDLEAAQAIAAAVRESSGGLPAVRALGVPLASKGATQVSMNLLDYRRTSVADVLDRVRREAAALSTRVIDAELVGLLPAAARTPDFDRDPLLRPLGLEKTIEERLRRANGPHQP